MIKRSSPSQVQSLDEERLHIAHRRETYWPACTLDIDPRALPAQYNLPAAQDEDDGAGFGWRITLMADRIMVHDTNAQDGIVANCIPISSFDAVIIRAGSMESGEVVVTVNLYQAESGLEIPVHTGASTRLAAERWYTWAGILGLPVRMLDDDGNLRDPYAGTKAARVSDHRRRGLGQRKTSGRSDRPMPAWRASPVVAEPWKPSLVQ